MNEKRDPRPRLGTATETMGLDAASCAALLEKSRYDVKILPQLEEYCAGSSYDLDANLATLKLYQFHPEALKVPIVAKIFVKALMHLPHTAPTRDISITTPSGNPAATDNSNSLVN